jgi:hypothetical protein
VLDLGDHRGELLVGQPYRRLPVDHAVGSGVGDVVGEVTVEVAQQ